MSSTTAVQSGLRRPPTTRPPTTRPADPVPPREIGRWTTMVAMSGSPTNDRVLVVDDDRAIRESLARALELDGYEVSLASDGAAALATIRESRPDIAVVDVMMP